MRQAVLQCARLSATRSASFPDLATSMRSDTNNRGKRETHLQRSTLSGGGYQLANPAVERASTVLFSDLDMFESAAQRRFETPYYGRYGTRTSFEVERIVADLEGSHKTFGTASGHAAITAVLLAVLSPGDHALFPDCVYGPTRQAAEGFLRRYGVEVDFYPGRTGKEIERFSKPATRMIWIEAPGSLTYEIPEIDELVGFAKTRNIMTVADNTWASSWLFQPLAHGIDISVLSATKYMSGHSDAFGGFISLSGRHRAMIEGSLTLLGAPLSPDSAYLIQRGLRTMPVRMRQQAASARQVASALGTAGEITEIFCPALPSSPDHDRWKTYFSGGNGLLTFALADAKRSTISDFVHSLQCFRLGVSWGGFESLIWPTRISGTDTCGKWLVRLSVGLEAPEDLINDLRQALQRPTSASIPSAAPQIRG